MLCQRSGRTGADAARADRGQPGRCLPTGERSHAPWRQTPGATGVRDLRRTHERQAHPVVRGQARAGMESGKRQPGGGAGAVTDRRGDHRRGRAGGAGSGGRGGCPRRQWERGGHRASQRLPPLAARLTLHGRGRGTHHQYRGVGLREARPAARSQGREASGDPGQDPGPDWSRRPPGLPGTRAFRFRTAALP